MKLYPVYSVRAKKPVMLGNDSGQTMGINIGDVGTFQVLNDPLALATATDRFLIEAVFNGRFIRFKPKWDELSVGLPAALTSKGEFEIIPFNTKETKSKFSGTSEKVFPCSKAMTDIQIDLKSRPMGVIYKKTILGILTVIRNCVKLDSHQIVAIDNIVVSANGFTDIDTSHIVPFNQFAQDITGIINILRDCPTLDNASKKNLTDILVKIKSLSTTTLDSSHTPELFGQSVFVILNAIRSYLSGSAKKGSHSNIDGESNNLNELANANMLDEDFGVSNFAGGGHPHGGGGGRGGRWWGGYGYGYPYIGYPIFQDPSLIYPSMVVTRKIQITPLGIKFMNRKKGETIAPLKEDAILWQIRNGKQFLETDLKQQMGYTDFDIIINWLSSKGYITIL